MNKQNDIENRLAEIYAVKKNQFALRPEQLAELRMRAAAKNSAPAKRAHVKIFFAGIATAASIAACAAFGIYLKESNDTLRAAHVEIARLQGELEKTKNLRQEFARIVEIYGQELIAGMLDTGVDVETAFMIAEEKYVSDPTAFNEDFKKAMDKAKFESGLSDNYRKGSEL